MGRTVKHFGARTISDDEVKPLVLVPLFPGESIDRITLDCYCAALTDLDVSNPIGLDWLGVGVPWNYLDAMDGIADGTQADWSTLAQWDAAFNQLLLAADEGTGEVYGGDRTIDVEQGTEDDDNLTEDELMVDNPMGVYKWFEQDVLGRPYAAAGNNTIRFGDDLRTSIPGTRFQKAPLGQVIMFGMRRWDMSQAQVDFGVELDSTDAIRAFALLKAGVINRVNSQIKSDGGAFGDLIRTVMFGGDIFIEASTVKTDDVKAYVKATVHISSPYTRNPR